MLALVGTLVLLALGAGFSNAADLVRATSACFVAVYLLSLASAVRILAGRIRACAIVSLALVAVVAVFSEALPASCRSRAALDRARRPRGR